jgi:hypothetical protein
MSAFHPTAHAVGFPGALSVKVSYTLDGQGRFVGGKNLKDSIFFADGTKISGHQKM